VFNANYLVYFDLAFTELWRSALGPWQRMLEEGIDAVVAEANVRFRAPAHFDEQLQLHARLTRLGTTAIATEIDVTREGELLAQGMLRLCAWQAIPGARPIFPSGCTMAWSASSAPRPNLAEGFLRKVRERRPRALEIGRRGS